MRTREDFVPMAAALIAAHHGNLHPREAAKRGKEVAEAIAVELGLPADGAQARANAALELELAELRGKLAEARAELAAAPRLATEQGPQARRAGR